MSSFISLFAHASPTLAKTAYGLQAYDQQANGPQVFLNGEKLDFTIQPMMTHDTTFVPMRNFFEQLNAQVTWQSDTQTVVAVKEALTLTYRIGDTVAYRNGEPLPVPVPGRLINGTTFVPIRFVSVALGSDVGWESTTRTVTITTRPVYETTVTWGVNLRDKPGSDEESQIIRMLPRGERIHILKILDVDWLWAETQDGTKGYVSAKPRYTDFDSADLTRQRGDELIAYGETFMATPYKFGASLDQTESFDCSSFTYHVFKEVLGIELPRVSHDQAETGIEVNRNELRKGDLLFFTARGLPIGHVGIYAGDGQILQTYSEKYGVTYSDFDGAWEERFVTARRLF